MDFYQQALKLHEQHHGKIEVASKVTVETADDLSVAYTPGVAEPCRQIARDKSEAYRYTAKGNLIAVVSNGTAVLGLGDIGPDAAMPVMEGKSILFKRFGGVDAFPVCIDAATPEEVIETVKRLAPTFGGINLEDIKSPDCFEIEETLERDLDIPVFHDDQHGTAIVTSAAMLNAMKVTGKKMGEMTIVINGAGAAGIAIGELMLHMGFGEVILCDSKGIVCEGDPRLNAAKAEMAKVTNRKHLTGTLADALKGADAFVGVSAANVVSREMVASMNNGIVFAMANPVPEIMPDEAKAGGAAVVGTGRSDFPNQINNVLVFPGIFKGALAAHAPQITEEMEIKAAYAIADLVTPEQLNADYVIPSALDKTVAAAVAQAVASCVK